MKKVIAMIMVLVMAAISASGCGGSGTENSAEAGSERTYADEIPYSDYADNVFKQLLPLFTELPDRHGESRLEL